ncbi:hypothetical protein CXK86_20200 [Paenibacillus sp. BGI2013]|uniref:DUF4238 domain-containing protein n=1 Tax=Paenibacillus sp. BGI2013 TaxID=2058902 RepID=UPI000C6EFE27|nr:DUF4238 domain-containing protein [Paenibacillus sp. BGI2013]PKQ89375.1 hypothetical protein CXK86_20200 [Paenibacillus sp. BGI2013]
MDTEAIYHHLTPQTYMKSWKHGNSSIYVVKKGINDLGEEKNTKRFAGIDDYHTIRAGSLSGNEEDFKSFFEPLKEYVVKLDGNILKDPIDMNLNFYRFNEWSISDLKGNVVSDEVKRSLRSTILSKTRKDIEVNWSQQYENDWNKTHDTIANAVSSKDTHLLNAIKRDDLIKFMVSIEWRSKPYHPVLQNALDVALRGDLLGIDFKSIKIPEEERLFPFLETVYDEYAHSYILKLYRQFLNGEGLIMAEVEKFVNESTLVFLRAPANGEFITSDNPVCRFINSEGKIEYIFPLDSHIACAVVRGDHKKHYVVRDLTKDELVDYNNRLKDNCNEGYILRVQDREMYFGDE